MKFPPVFNFNPLDVRDLDLWFSEGDFDIINMQISFQIITNDIIIVTLHYFGWQVMPEYHWNHWIDPIVFPYILPITQIALTGALLHSVFGYL